MRMIGTLVVAVHLCGCAMNQSQTLRPGIYYHAILPPAIRASCHPANDPAWSALEGKAIAVAKQRILKASPEEPDLYYRVADTDNGYRVDILPVDNYDKNGSPQFSWASSSVWISPQWEVTKVVLY